jgi:hypothetical protein
MADILVTYNQGKWICDDDAIREIFKLIDAERKMFGTTNGLPEDDDALVLKWIRDNYGDVEMVEFKPEPIERVKGRIY